MRRRSSSSREHGSISLTMYSLVRQPRSNFHIDTSSLVGILLEQFDCVPMDLTRTKTSSEFNYMPGSVYSWAVMDLNCEVRA